MPSISIPKMNEEIFTASGSWLCPQGVTKALVIGCGGGAGGQYVGGKGAAAIAALLDVVAGTSYAITIGAGGAGVSSVGTQNAGGDSSFDVLQTFPGAAAGPYQGGGGFNGDITAAGRTPGALPGHGGVVNNTPGADGQSSGYASGGSGGAAVSGQGSGGGGGASLGAGGNGSAGNGSGSAGTLGGGGGGAGASSGTGGTGGRGEVRVYWMSVL